MREDVRMARRIMGDTARANWSALIAVPFAAAFYLFVARRLGVEIGDTVRYLVSVFIVFWPLFGTVYLVWTHLAYRNADAVQLRVASRRERITKRRWWHRLVGYGGATDWTMAGAMVAVALTVAIAQEPAFRDQTIFVVLGLATVAASWALMVYAFALEYLRLDAVPDAEAGHGGADERERDAARRSQIVFPFEEEPRFGDYLTLAVLMSTMAATASAEITSRRGWRIARTNVVLAFAFNSVIVAMMVSVLFGGLTT
ncbi:DUF1345 domain-containing protein [Pseudoclavibacter sp. RFBJ3]|nr:DUF1345 domain-containing protein [Pseudoclavibacter sp. RFBJ5]PPF93254.1 DUF1345 domain-containing protein [Pseudoclavibacter sp. RFBJ3]PPF98900.1 DUF1345 domain-containing protein [Pseudoclavibacter sp. RFBH5]PPG24967.1 DUF1345 domain-containing protein [Pseudoclavibacter sp. RFBI4]